MTRFATGVATVALAVASLCQGMRAEAHPHVFVDARAELVFDEEGRLAAVRHIWQFDEAFAAFAVQGLDADGDGQLSDDELAPLAKVNVESLAEFGFFAFLSVGGEDQTFRPPDEYWLNFHGGRLTLFYTLPLATPVAVRDRATMEVFDPEYFVAFDFVRDGPVTLKGDHRGDCGAAPRPDAPRRGAVDGTAGIEAARPARRRGARRTRVRYRL